jgi:DNA modification methylase
LEENGKEERMDKGLIQTDRFICGDAEEILKSLPSNSIDLIVADPPYNLGKDYGHTIDKKDWSEYKIFTENWLQESLRILKPTASIYAFMGVEALFADGRNWLPVQWLDYLALYSRYGTNEGILSTARGHIIFYKIRKVHVQSRGYSDSAQE